MSEREPGDDEDLPPVVPQGNPLRWGGGLAMLGGAFVLGVVDGFAPWSPRVGVPIGLVAAALAAFGAVWFLGSFHDDIETDDAPPSVAPAALARPLAVLFGGLAVTVVALRMAVAGVSSSFTTSVLATGGFVVALAGAGLALEAIGVLDATERRFHKREGFWLLVYSTLVFLPTLGVSSLVDPWETHYGEVSRELLARRDWISTWWAHEGWFFSKPILSFWMQALAMATLGVNYEPGGMLAAARDGATPWPEWAVRFPTFLVALVATYILYKGVASTFGRRAGLLSGVVLTTMPTWALLSHQTMTDMPFIAALTAAMGLLLLALSEHESRRVRIYRVAGLTLSAHGAVVGLLVLLVFPQLVYLVSRNVHLNYDDVVGLRAPPIFFAGDRFTSGSAGNCGVLPGNAACATQAPVFARVQPAAQALLWAVCLAVALYLEWGERRARRLYALAGYVAVARAVLAKGPAGVVLPLGALAAWLFVTRRTRVLADLELPAGALVILVVSMPWFVAMFARHGTEFTDRLLFHDMYKRAFEHVHDTNATDDTSFRYYVWQLGYATFPWVGVLPAALASSIAVRDENADRRGAVALVVGWFLFTFALFSYMQTKFHHYIAPAVPPLAILVGVFLDGALVRMRSAGPRLEHARSAFGVVAMGGALLAGLVARDMIVDRPELPSDARLLNLVSYNYDRKWPATLDFATPLLALGLASIGALASLAVPRLLEVFGGRAPTPRGPGFLRSSLAPLALLASLSSVWLLGVYLPRLSPHWGQREIVLRYVLESKQRAGPLIAYQLNWKGENFYSGNQLASFPETGKPFREWVDDQRRKGVKNFYVIAMQGRTRSVRSELGNPRAVDELTSDRENNKFVLLRVTYD
ncbi:MAG: glycosyltransferase family 39 protein [Polyangiaceae bacterium]